MVRQKENGAPKVSKRAHLRMLCNDCMYVYLHVFTRAHIGSKKARQRTRSADRHSYRSIMVDLTLGMSKQRSPILKKFLTENVRYFQRIMFVWMVIKFVKLILDEK